MSVYIRKIIRNKEKFKLSIMIICIIFALTWWVYHSGKFIINDEEKQDNL